MSPTGKDNCRSIAELDFKRYCLNFLGYYNGLDRCPDKGKEGFDCYVALAVLSRNVQRIGEIVQKKRRKQEVRKKRKLSKAA